MAIKQYTFDEIRHRIGLYKYSHHRNFPYFTSDGRVVEGIYVIDSHGGFPWLQKQAVIACNATFVEVKNYGS